MPVTCEPVPVGWFSKRPTEPVVHEAVARVVFVRAPIDAVVARMQAYGELADATHGSVASFAVGSAAGWTCVRLPDAVHPWLLHNVAFWLLDVSGTSDVVARSGPSGTHAGYTLVVDPELADAMCGWADDGEPITVSVPTNDVVRGDPVPVRAAPDVPSAFDGWRWVTIVIDDPGAAMNPTNDGTVRSRARLRRGGSWDGV